MNWSKWPNFSEDEFRSRGDGSCKMNEEFMDRLQRLRTEYAQPMGISSGYRDPEYNAKISSTGLSGPHTTGRACDVKVFSTKEAFRLVALAIAHGFTGIGIKINGRGMGFIHLDDLGGRFPRPGMWGY